MDTVTTGLLWLSAMAMGLMAGLYYAFSAFVMRALDTIDRPAAIRAMQAINRIIVRSSFLPIFFASALASVALVGLALTDISAPGTGLMASAGALYAIGMFGVTMLGNVPLNNQLDALASESEEGAFFWTHYRAVWTRWNHARALSCLVALALVIGALIARG